MGVAKVIGIILLVLVVGWSVFSAVYVPTNQLAYFRAWWDDDRVTLDNATLATVHVLSALASLVLLVLVLILLLTGNQPPAVSYRSDDE